MPAGVPEPSSLEEEAEQLAEALQRSLCIADAGRRAAAPQASEVGPARGAGLIGSPAPEADSDAGWEAIDITLVKSRLNTASVNGRVLALL